MWDEFEKTIRPYLPYLPGDEPLPPDAELRDYGLDSLATVELLGALESRFETRFPEEALSMETFRTPSVLWSALSASLGPAAG
ncbi:acyl carrier protein [Actinomadura latina]|uniref:Acyl carrier protein n=1 Tax=Actinomadura latina TaxID=163603 RepID=A0A846ZCS3_9ACTN|nr:acyl carrier protein [Actinomadura latina]NKZ08315.1 acyl carrier protein [Actinomadura latina]